jgi:HEAT repeat protein
MELLSAAAEALAELGRQSATGVLVRLARHPFLAVRAAAARGLAALGTPEARAEVALVAASDPSAAVRESAREALREGGQQDE